MGRRKKQVDLSILERHKRVATAYLRGQTQWEIARAESVDQATISRDLKAVQEEWLSAALTAVEHRKAQELAKIDAQELRYLEAWERSCRPREITQSKAKSKAARAGKRQADSTEAMKRTEHRDGNPRFLEGIDRCVEMRLRIFGLLKQTHEHSGPDGAPIGVIEVTRPGDAPTDGSR